MCVTFQESESERKLSAQTKSTPFRLFGFDICALMCHICIYISIQVFACLLLCFDFVLALHECRCTCDTFHAFMSKSHIIFTYIYASLSHTVCACGCLRMHIIASMKLNERGW